MKQAGRMAGAMLGLLMLAGGLAGCGRDIPIDFHRAVSPCIDLPTAYGFDGATELVKILTTDFKNKDTDGDGSLTLKEAQATTAKPNLIDESLFAALNPKDGKMTTADIKKGASTLFKWATYYKVKLLNRFDRNVDHVLTIDEVKGYLNIDQAAFDAADAADDTKVMGGDDKAPGNGDKKLDADEFLGLVLHQNAQSCGTTEEAADTTDAAAASLRSAPMVYRPAVAPTPYRRY